MAILNCISIGRPLIVASSSSSSSSSSHDHPQLKPNSRAEYKRQQQARVIEIERAIGAGMFRGRESIEENEKAGLVDYVVGKNEESVEKKLRESGEWLVYHTETASRSVAKQILMILFLWIIPLWISAFLLASGILHLPVNTPFLHFLLQSLLIFTFNLF